MKNQEVSLNNDILSRIVFSEDRKSIEFLLDGFEGRLRDIIFDTVASVVRVQAGGILEVKADSRADRVGFVLQNPIDAYPLRIAVLYSVLNCFYSSDDN